MLVSIISFLCPLLAAAHRVEVILVPCSLDVGYFYDIIFPSCFDTYQGLTSTVSRGLSKNQRAEFIQLEEYWWELMIYLKEICHHPSFLE